MQLGQWTEWKRKTVSKIHVSHPTIPSLHIFSLAILICAGSLLLDFASTLKPASRNHREETTTSCVTLTHVLMFLDQNSGFAHALELQLCLSSFLNKDRLKHCFKCLPPLGLQSSLFREEFSKLETKDLIQACLNQTGPCTDLKIWSDHAKEAIRLGHKKKMMNLKREKLVCLLHPFQNTLDIRTICMYSPKHT